MHLGQSTGDLDQWQRIDFRSSGLSRRDAAQIKVAIRTKGPSMQGLIRIPGAPASNFDTGNGLTVIDLINIGNDSRGYADIVALEILLTQTMPGQFYEVLAVGNLSKVLHPLDQRKSSRQSPRNSLERRKTQEFNLSLVVRCTVEVTNGQRSGRSRVPPA